MTELYVVRHGETEWSANGRHTSVTDLPLTETGEEGAKALASRLAEVEFDLVLTSPRQRARRTAELAGFPYAAVDEDLVEWAYGDYEGVTTATIRETIPGWSVWTHPTPGGESADDVSARLEGQGGALTGGEAVELEHGLVAGGAVATLRRLNQGALDVGRDLPPVRHADAAHLEPGLLERGERAVHVVGERHDVIDDDGAVRMGARLGGPAGAE